MHPPGHGGALTRLQDVIEGALPVRAIAPAWAYSCCAVESESSTVAETFFGVETWLRCCCYFFFLI